MPVLFVGHGSPMNIIQNNAYTQSLQKLGTTLPKPDAILVISAHWLTRGTFVCDASQPQQIYDFYGFPEALYNIKYRPPGSPSIAHVIAKELTTHNIQLDHTWGLDHASWAVLKHLYPAADIPVLEMSLDVTKNEEDHYMLGKRLAFLRNKNILIIGSGNIVHNLREVNFNENADPFPWATEFDEYVKNSLLQKDHSRLTRKSDWGTSGKLSVPTNDHYLPMLYSIALQEENDNVRFFHVSIQNASVSMRCFMIS